jgi:hypothetical protein
MLFKILTLRLNIFAYISSEYLSLLANEDLASIDQTVSPWMEMAGNFEIP